MKTIYSAIILSTLLVTVLCFAPNQVNAASCQTTTAIVYSNGMFNDQDAADLSKQTLENVMVASNPAYGNAQLYEFHLAYASDRDGLGQSTLDQILEVARYQYPNALIGSFWRWLGGIEAAPQWFQDFMTTAAALMDDITYMVDADFQKQLNGDTGFIGYRALLEDGKRVLIVAHSQGNFYANAVYNTLTRENSGWAKRFGVTAVATPANYVAGGGPHLTLNEDYVIRAIPLALPVTPSLGSSKNIQDLGAAKWADATIGHNFVKWYLAGPFSRGIILNNIDSVLSKMVAPFKHDWLMIHNSTQEGRRCLKDDQYEAGFYVVISAGWAQVIATSLNGPEASAHAVRVSAPIASGGYLSHEIVPVPGGVGIFSFESRLTDWVTNDSALEYGTLYEEAGVSAARLITMVWDKATNSWSSQTLVLTNLPTFDVDFGFSLLLRGASPQPVASSYYRSHYHGYQTGPYRSVIPVIANHWGTSIVNGQLNNQVVIMSVDNAVLAVDSIHPGEGHVDVGLPDRYVYYYAGYPAKFPALDYNRPKIIFITNSAGFSRPIR